MTATTYTETQILELAAAFCVRLEEELSSQEFSEMVRRNAAETDPNVCHSHDFCDANQVMIDAMELIGHDLDISDDAHRVFVDRAWTTAKKAGFNVK